ncbi:MAG TPA: radical SAM family heme chaperone HemW [Smithellaceae bacterium]|jgi:oxygen-independent coproporphyrinogen-3 oxidase|nr:radical SAM family heme chaperone HemW [Smithellaceae bacterium]HOD31304.1 radical SAM family heme chaperone HemW [Smithellaceae bacterium]HOF77774.1 radical SAM family heme chaperone HemW [Smithellaceae bacterium]HOM69939.1 radical SAM family heme chaperone HemW [Smithellaceae bacterium]HOS09325.1 radical SAM family heme chaperone HemW [Smithellaceae bacterium]
MQNEKAGLYIHIPFCQSKCAYCNFYSVTSVNLIPQFVAALIKEIKLHQRQFDAFDTVYIGGGTPSLLSFGQLSEILAAINEFHKLDKEAEITMEVNPGDVSVEYFKLLISLGINRLNIGVQSFDDKILKFLGRRHNANEAHQAIMYARAAGFKNLGIDLIYGVYGQSINLWKKTLAEATTFRPEHFSCYELTLEASAPLYKRYLEKKIKKLNEKQQKKFFFTTAEELEKVGYIHYEVSNFARKNNFKSRHNMKYWKHAPYLGIGPAAHSFLENRRWWNVKSAKDYLNNVPQGISPVESEEILTAEQLKLETLFLALRTNDGIDLSAYQKRFRTDLLEEKKMVIESLINSKLLELKKGFLRPTLAGMAVADSLALI